MPSFRIAVFLLVLALAVGCSVQSRQLNALNQLISGDKDLLEQAEWSAEWAGDQYTLYAVNAPNETIFGYDRRIRVHFNGWNITEIIGLYPNGETGRIEFQANELIYFANDRLVARHQCTDWVETDSGALNSTYTQNCTGRDPYANEIDIDEDGFITRLQFLIHPEYPQLTMMPAALLD